MITVVLDTNVYGWYIGEEIKSAGKPSLDNVFDSLVCDSKKAYGEIYA